MLRKQCLLFISSDPATDTRSTIAAFDRASFQLQNTFCPYRHRYCLCIFDNAEQEPACSAHKTLRQRRQSTFFTATMMVSLSGNFRPRSPSFMCPLTLNCEALFLKREVPLRCHYFQVHSNPEWLYLLGSQIALFINYSYLIRIIIIIIIIIKSIWQHQILRLSIYLSIYLSRDVITVNYLC